MITKFHVPTSNDMGLLNGSKTSWLTCDLTCLSEDQPCYLRNIPHRISERTFLEFELNDRATRKWRVNAKCFTIVFGKEPPLLRVLRRILTALIISSPCIPSYVYTHRSVTRSIFLDLVEPHISLKYEHPAHFALIWVFEPLVKSILERARSFISGYSGNGARVPIVEMQFRESASVMSLNIYHHRRECISVE